MDEPSPPHDNRPRSPGREAASGKPTPVRATLGENGEDPTSLRFEGRAVQMGDEDWWAEELGWATSGRREDRGTLLLLVGFRPASDPQAPYQREALLTVSSLDALSQAELESALAGATAFRTIPDEPKAFFGPRGKRRAAGGRPRPGGKGRGRRGRS